MAHLQLKPDAGGGGFRARQILGVLALHQIDHPAALAKIGIPTVGKGSGSSGFSMSEIISGVEIKSAGAEGARLA